MKNYYATLEVPVGCGVAEIRQAYRRLVQDNLDNEARFADLKEAHEVLTTPARRADYDRAVWGETFAESGGQAFVSGASEGATLLPGVTVLPGATMLPGMALPAASGAAGGAGRCPMGVAAQCPVLLGRTEPADTYCPECGFLLAGLRDADSVDAPGAADVDEYARLEETGGRSHRLRAGMNMVGRESADILLPDKTVSRQHARLEVGEDGTVTLEDLSSTNGTQVGGDVLVPHIARPLGEGDRIRFGSVVTELRLPLGVLKTTETVGTGAPVVPEPAVPEREPARPGGEAVSGPARAQVVETREEGGRTFPLVPGVTTFGRRAESSFVIQGDPYVSGSHAQIIADGDVFRLTDVGSTNGTLLNGQRLAINEPVTLSPEDVVLIGGTALRFELLDAPAPEEPPAEPSAEPSERNAQEYDVPEDGGTTGSIHPAQETTTPTQVER